MKKILLIVEREYLSRVKKRSFLVTTLLVPILISVIISLMIYASVKSDKQLKISIWDESGLYEKKIKNTSKSYSIQYTKNQNQLSTKDLLKHQQSDILVHIYKANGLKPDSIRFYSEGSLGIAAKEYLTNKIEDTYHLQLLEQSGISQNRIDSIKNENLNIKSFDLNNNETNTDIASGIGYGMGFLIYMIIFIYGAGVMRGVMEEKTNRIAEVIISSVTPFQLMMGKIIGIALVGLTQFLLWISLVGILSSLAPMLLMNPTDVMQPAMDLSNPEAAKMIAKTGERSEILSILKGQNWGMLGFYFLFYFLGGYFLYASMFAAVGSLVNEDPQEAQQLTIPITMPIIAGIIIMSTSIKNPDNPLAIFGSIFPLTSPIVMLSRLPYNNVPLWQLLLSMGLLILGFIGMTWVSAKIYRTGILMYGKKVTWKEIFKWLREN